MIIKKHYSYIVVYIPGLLSTGSFGSSKNRKNKMLCIVYPLTENIENLSKKKVLYRVPLTENIENLSKAKVFYMDPLTEMSKIESQKILSDSSRNPVIVR